MENNLNTPLPVNSAQDEKMVELDWKTGLPLNSSSEVSSSTVSSSTEEMVELDWKTGLPLNSSSEVSSSTVSSSTEEMVELDWKTGLPLEATIPERSEEEKRDDKVDSLVANLPETLKVDFLAVPKIFGKAFGVDYTEWDDLGVWDTGYKLDPEQSAALVGLGNTMTDMAKGTRQIFGSKEEVARLREEEKAIKELRADKDLGKYFTAGEIAGYVVDPIAFMFPSLKAQGMKKALVYGTTAGAVSGALGYTEEGENRAVNTVVGGSLGAGVGAAIGLYKAKKAREAMQVRVAQLKKEGYDVKEIGDLLKNNYTEELDAYKQSVKDTGRKIHIPKNEAEATEILKKNKGLYKVAYQVPESAPTRKLLDPVFGVLHTRIQRYSPTLAKQVRDFEYHLSVNTHNYHMLAKDFGDAFGSLTQRYQDEVNDALLNGEFAEARRVLGEQLGTSGIKAMDEALKVFSGLERDLRKYGILKDKPIADYWTRKVTDPKGLAEALKTRSASNWDDIEKTLAKKNSDLIKDRGYGLTPFEENSYVQSILTKETGPRTYSDYVNRRKVAKITDMTREFYANPVESIHSFINSAVWDIQQARLFGAKAVQDGMNETGILDITKMIDSWTSRNDEIKNLSGSQITELRELLKSRLSVGHQETNDLVKGFKNAIYATTLFNPYSALTQAGEIGSAMYKNGVINTALNTAKVLTNNHKITVKELGLAYNFLAEMQEASRYNKMYEALTKVSGFQAFDRMGKAVLVNSSLDKLKDAASDVTSRGFKRMEKKYRNAWGKQFNDAVRDLRAYKKNPSAENITENIRLMVWHELSDMQPISYSEMPKAYLDNPTLGRLAYTLKSFIIKQFDIMRNDVYRNFKKGEVSEGMLNLTKYITFVGGANLGVDAIKQHLRDWSRGDAEFGDFSDITDEMHDPFAVLKDGMDGASETGLALASFLRTFGVNEYLLNEVKREGPESIVAEIFLPPMQLISDPYKAVNIDVANMEMDIDWAKATRSTIPLGGKIISDLIQRNE